MNIVYHFRVRGTGAEAVHIAGIAGGFVELGHRVSFVSPSGVNPLEKRCGPASLVQPDRSVKALHALADKLPQLAFEGMELAYNAYAEPRLVRRVRSDGARLIYERAAFFNVAGAMARLRTGVPLIIEVNELVGHERVRDQKLVGLARALERYALRQASMIVTVSDFLTEHARAIVDDRVPVITVPNGVPKRWQQERSSAEELDRLRSSHALPKNGVVLFTGKLVHWHNFGNLLQAMKQARRTVPEATLLIVGDGPMQQSIERMASEMGIAQAVRLVGTVPHEEVRQFIELADVAVVPHTNAYRSPIKLFEYMAHGKAIVAPDMAPVRSAVQNEVSALLFEPGGSGLAEAVATLLREPALGSRLGEAARERAFRDFTWEGHAARILAALAETVSDERTVAAEAVQSEH